MSAASLTARPLVPLSHPIPKFGNLPRQCIVGTLDRLLRNHAANQIRHSVHTTRRRNLLKLNEFFVSHANGEDLGSARSHFQILPRACIRAKKIRIFSPESRSDIPSPTQ